MSNDVKGGKYFLPKKLVESLLMFVFPPRFLKLSPKFPKTIFHSAHIHTHTTTISGGRGHVLLSVWKESANGSSLHIPEDWETDCSFSTTYTTLIRDSLLNEWAHYVKIESKKNPWVITTVYSIKWAVWLLQLRMVQHWITFQSSVPLVITYICLGFFFSREKPQTISLCNLISAFYNIWFQK